jgi:hypothetical protein
MIKLLDIRSKDGSRQFFDLQKSISWDDLIIHLKKLDQLEIKEFLPSPDLGSWLDFSFKKFEFSVNEQIGMYWFFVENSSCPDEVLYQLAEHLSAIIV